MDWFAQKLEAFIAAAVIAVAGALASQTQPFIVQYLHRTGDALEVAQAHLEDVRNGLRYRVMGDTVRAELDTQASARVAALEGAYDSALNANPLVRPILVWRSGDPDIVAGTRREFVPALPVTRGSIAFTIVGMILGFLAYEVVKLPLAALAREPRRRRFRRRG